MITTSTSQNDVSLKSLLCLNRKFLVYNLILRNLKLRYRKSYVGIFWTMLIPAANAVVYNVVFNHIMKVQIPNYLLFLLSGLLPWSFFSMALTQGMESLVVNQPVLNKVPIPAFSFVLADNLTAFLNFALAIPVLVIVALLTGVSFNIAQLLLPIVFLMIFLQAFGLSLILGYLYVYFRDLRHIMAIFIQIWFYLTPIIYTTKMIPESYRFILWLNPLAISFQFIHASISPVETIETNLLLIPALWTIAIVTTAVWIVRRYNSVVVESL